MVGPLAAHLDQVFIVNIGQGRERKTSQNKLKLETSVATLATEYHGDRLFKYQPGRAHSSFPGYIYKRNIKNPSRLKARLLKYSKNLDITKLVKASNN